MHLVPNLPEPSPIAEEVEAKTFKRNYQRNETERISAQYPEIVYHLQNPYISLLCERGVNCVVLFFFFLRVGGKKETSRFDKSLP